MFLPTLLSITVLFVAWRIILLWIQIKKTNTKGLGLACVFKTRQNLSKELSQYVSTNDIQEGFVHIMIGPKLGLIAVDPETAKFVLKSPQFVKYNFFKISSYVNDNFGTNLVTTDGEEWRKQRLLVNSGFNSRAYTAYYPIFVSLTEKTISKFGETIGKTDTECFSIFTKFTLDILGNSIFHYNFGSLEGKSDENYEAHKTLLSVVNRKIGILLSLFPWLEKFPIKDVEDIHSSVDSLKGLFQRIIDERKSGKKYGDIIEHLLESAENYGLSPIELMSNIWIFFVAGIYKQYEIN